MARKSRTPKPPPKPKPEGKEQPPTGEPDATKEKTGEAPETPPPEEERPVPETPPEPPEVKTPARKPRKKKKKPGPKPRKKPGPKANKPGKTPEPPGPETGVPILDSMSPDVLGELYEQFFNRTFPEDQLGPEEKAAAAPALAFLLDHYLAMDKVTLAWIAVAGPPALRLIPVFFEWLKRQRDERTK